MKKMEEDVMVIDDQNNKLNKVRNTIFLQGELQKCMFLSAHLRRT